MHQICGAVNEKPGTIGLAAQEKPLNRTLMMGAGALEWRVLAIARGNKGEVLVKQINRFHHFQKSDLKPSRFGTERSLLKEGSLDLRSMQQCSVTAVSKISREARSTRGGSNSCPTCHEPWSKHMIGSVGVTPDSGALVTRKVGDHGPKTKDQHRSLLPDRQLKIDRNRRAGRQNDAAYTRCTYERLGCVCCD
jgi:hypothetical protein